jgi:hypothetical protein
LSIALGYVPEPRTILLSVKKLLPSQTLTARRAARVPDPVEYWGQVFTLDNHIPLRDADLDDV